MPDFLVAEFLLQMLSLSQFCEKYVFFYDLLLSILDAQMDFQLLVKILPMHQQIELPVCPAQLAHIVPKLNLTHPLSVQMELIRTKLEKIIVRNAQLVRSAQQLLVLLSCVIMAHTVHLASVIA